KNVMSIAQHGHLKTPSLKNAIGNG
ncbi:MAG: hypothetical protein ACI9YB_003546, partial [Halioglobus sp.]